MGERFVSWSDPYTGAHPFLPVANKNKNKNIILNALKWTIVTPIIAIIRFPLILLLLVLLFAFDAVVQLVPASTIKRFLVRVVHFTFAGLIMWLFGFFSISVHTFSVKQGYQKLPVIKSGQFIIANHSSYLDLIYLAHVFSPQFTSVLDSGDLIPISLFSAFLQVIRNEPVTSGTPVKLSKLMKTTAQKWDGPVLVFPEGITTNGNITIATLPVVDYLPSRNDGHAFGIRYSAGDFSPAYSCGNIWMHMFWLSGQLWNNMQVSFIPSQDIISEGVSNGSEWLDVAWGLVSESVRLRRGKIDRRSKAPFLARYFGRT